MRTVPAAVVLCLLTTTATATDVANTEIPATVAECEARIQASPGDYASYLCFTDLVRMSGVAVEAVQPRLESLVRDAPSDPRPKMALAALLRFRDGKRARDLVDQALTQATAIGDPALIASAYLQSAVQHSVRRELEAAGADYAAAAEFAERAAIPTQIAACTIERARFHAFNGDELARGWMLISTLDRRDWYSDLPPRMRAHHLGSAAIIAGRLGLMREAYRLALRGLELTRDAGLSKQYATFQGMIVSHAASLPDIDRVMAERFARESIAQFVERGMQSEELQIRYDFSRWADEPEAWYQLQIVERESRNNPFCRPLIRMALQGMATLALNADPPRPDEALDLYSRALDEALSAGGLQEIATSRADYSLARLRIDPTDFAPAWETLDAIESLADLQTHERWSMELFSKRSPFYYALIDGLVRHSQLPQAATVLRRMQSRRLRDHLRRSGIRKPRETRGEIGELPDPRTAWLSFSIAPTASIGSWLILDTSEGRTAQPIAADGLPERIELWRGLIEQRSPAEPRAAARLFRDLFGEVLDTLDPAIDRLVIVPDRSLHAVPFGALRPDPSLPPLIDRFEIVTSPSIEFWAYRREAPRNVSGQHRALLLADPYPAQSPTLPPAWEEMGLRSTALGNLPFSRKEVRSARSMLGRDAEIRFGSEASEQRVREAAWGDIRLLHLAVHAVVDQEHPERSALILAGGDEQDGLWRPSEIALLPLRETVVVLSACRSADGRAVAGEAAMSLARAFLEAGATAVVAGLWDLRDEETAALVERFYSHVSQGRGVSESLVRAQRETWAAGFPAAAWSGLVVIGAGDVTPWVQQPAPRGRQALVLAALAAVAGIVGLILLVGRLRG